MDLRILNGFDGFDGFDEFDDFCTTVGCGMIPDGV